MLHPKINELIDIASENFKINKKKEELCRHCNFIEKK